MLLLGLLVLLDAVLPGELGCDGGLQAVCVSDCHVCCCGGMARLLSMEQEPGSYFCAVSAPACHAQVPTRRTAKR